MKLNKRKIAVFSDLHLGVHSNSADWHAYAMQWVRWFRDKCRDEGIEDIIFCGDWHHNRSEISVSTLQISADIFDMLSEFNIIAIIGNHDIYYKHRTDVNSLSIFRNRRNVTILDQMTTFKSFDRTITLCPWNTHPDHIPESDVIFGHFEIESFKMNAFKTCVEGVSAKDLLSKSKLVISGHFHTRHEKRFKDGTILYCGNPFQMDFGDAGNDKGIYILDLDSMDYKFILNTVSAKYIKLPLSELVRVGNITDSIKHKVAGNFVRFIVDMNISQDDMSLLQSKLQLLAPSEFTVDYDINFNRLIEDSDNKEDLSGIDIEQAIEEFVNLLEIDNKKDILDYTLNLYNQCK